MRRSRNKDNPSYSVWVAIRRRCNNPNTKDYRRYGERGITVCERWDVFQHFVDDMGDRPVGYEIDRRDNNLGYSPENCHWVTSLHNRRNRGTWGSSGWRGVTPHGTKWTAKLTVNSKTRYIGVFTTPADAATAVNFYAFNHGISIIFNNSKENFDDIQFPKSRS